MTRERRFVRALSVAPLWVLLTAAPVFAQLQAARVHGVVVDAQSTPVPGVGVTLTDPLGAVLRSTVTDPAGRFSFADVSPGRFTLRAAPGRAATASMAVVVEAALPVEVVVRLAPAVEETIQVEGRFDPPSTRASIAGSSLGHVPVRVRGRSLQDAVATLPGWATEDNGLLHARGVDDGFLYVIDGVPVYERIDALNGVAPETPSLASVNVVTGYVPPEFGYKAGGVIELRSESAADRWTVMADAGGGTFGAAEGGAVGGGAIGRSAHLTLGGSSERSGRYLDPVHPDNLHNQGGASSLFGQVQARPGTRDDFRLGWRLGRAEYDVPNTEEQEEAGQDQRQRVSQGAATASWQRVWSDRTVTQVAAYHRRGEAALAGSAFDTPLFASADRSLIRSGGLAGVSHQRGAHLLKAGLEGQTLTLDETFSFVVTDPEEGEEAGLTDAALEHDADDPFDFEGRARPTLWSLYVQDHWQASARLAVAAGVRFDRSALLLDRHQWSPRAGLSYRASSATVLRASASRFFQPPQPEYLLLSSSPEARALSPFADEEGEGGADVEPERQWLLEAGIEHRFRRWRLDAAYWWRDQREVADPNVFFGTTVIFPNAVAKGRAHGLDARVEVPRWRGWSGYGSVSVGRVRQTGPITGGVFLEDEVGDIEPGETFVPDHDQRVVAAGGVTWEHPSSGLAVSLATRFESGTPIQRDEEDEEELAERPGADLVDFDRGRVEPRTLVSVLAAWPMVDTDRARVELRGGVLNLFDERYAFNFGNPFSGTHFGASRSATVSVRVTLR